MKKPPGRLRGMYTSFLESLAGSLDESIRKDEAIKALGIHTTDEPQEATRKLALSIVDLQAEVAELRRQIEASNNQ